MNKLHLLIFCSLFFLHKNFGQAPTIEWQKNIADPLKQMNYVAYDISKLSDDDFLVVGNSFNDFPNDFKDEVMVFKMDENGEVIWNTNYEEGTNSNEHGYAGLENAEGEIFIGGGYSYTVSSGGVGYGIGFHKLHDNGEANDGFFLQNYEQIYDMEFGTDDDIITVSSHGRIRKIPSNLSSTGVSTNMNNFTSIESIAKMDNGNYALAGWKTTTGSQGTARLGVIKENLQTVFTKTYTFDYYAFFREVKTTSDGGFIIIGDVNTVGSSPQQSLMLKTDSQGNEEWRIVFDDTNYNKLRSVIQTSDGGFVAAGNKNYLAWIVKVNDLGIIEWQSTYNNSPGFSSNANSIVQTNDGGYLFTGLHDNVDELTDVWVVKLFPDTSPPPTPCNSVLPGFEYVGEFEGHDYFVSLNDAQPAAAQLVAQQNDGYLAVINSQEENYFLQQNISEMTYIGLNDVDSEGNLIWENGDPLSYNNINPCSFCNENSEDYDYVIMAPWDGVWSFSSFWSSRKYIVEIPCSANTGITISCPQDMYNLPGAGPGNPSVQIFYDFPIASTDCPQGGLNVTIDDVTLASGNYFHPYTPNGSTATGFYTISFTAEDACGNTTFCSFNLSVEPWVATTSFTFPDNVTVIATSPDGAYVSWDEPAVTTDCPSGVTVSNISASAVNGGLFPIGTTNVYYHIFGNGTPAEGCITDEYPIFGITVLPANTNDCPDDISGFTAIGEFGDSKYFISNDDSQPVAAQLVAEQNNGYLAVINSQEENDFLQQHISEMTYIGLSDVDSEGDLVWGNGDPLNYNNINPCNFCNENSEEQDYVIMAPWDGAWSFSSLWSPRKYIVEIPCSSTLTDPNIGNSFAVQNTNQVGQDQLVIEKLHPNPAMDFIFTTIQSPIEQEVEVHVFDARGSVMKNVTILLQEGKNVNRISISDLTGGFYSIYIPNAQGKSVTKRFVKVGD